MSSLLQRSTLQGRRPVENNARRDAGSSAEPSLLGPTAATNSTRRACYLEAEACRDPASVSLKPFYLVLCLTSAMSMKLRHMKTLLPPTDGMCKVTAICFSPNNRRLAVITVERIVYLFDENGERKEKFSTKPREKVRLGCKYQPYGNSVYVGRLCLTKGLRNHWWRNYNRRMFILITIDYGS